jgi:hypothetical protein
VPGRSWREDDGGRGRECSSCAPTALMAVAIATIVAGCDGALIDITDSADAVRGSGTVISETRNVSGFDRVVLHGSGEVMIDVTGTDSITIEAEDNIMALLSSDIGGGQLDLDVEGRVSPSGSSSFPAPEAPW